MFRDTANMTAIVYRNKHVKHAMTSCRFRRNGSTRPGLGTEQSVLRLCCD